VTPARSQTTRGFIIAVGGAEEKIGDVAILRRFANLCGGKSCGVAIIPTASEVAETGSRYEELFHSLGGGSGSTCWTRWTGPSSPGVTSSG